MEVDGRTTSLCQNNKPPKRGKSLDGNSRFCVRNGKSKPTRQEYLEMVSRDGDVWRPGPRSIREGLLSFEDTFNHILNPDVPGGLDQYFCKMLNRYFCATKSMFAGAY